MIKDVTIIKTEILSDNWYVLKKVTYEYVKANGERMTQSREAYDRGNGAAILLYNPQQQTIVLTRQFRLPTYINGNEGGLLTEVCAGLLDDDNAEDCIKRETEEETGYRVGSVRKVFEAYMSPGSVTEKLHFFVAEYASQMKIGQGGGAEHEEENIEVLELSFAEARQMLKTGEIQDAKTIMLLQYALLEGLIV